MIKVISFDIGGTLLIDEENSNYDLNSLALLLELPYEKVRNAYKKIFQKYNGTFDELLNMFCKELDIVRNNKVDDFIKNKFAVKSAQISQDKIELIKKLKEKGYKVILFSNSCCLLKNNFDRDFLSMIDEVFYSWDIGFTKNESESYRYIEKKMGYLPEEFLHIGDTLKSDYIIPIENGWNALYYGVSDLPKVKNIQKLDEITEQLNYILKK